LNATERVWILKANAGDGAIPVSDIGSLWIELLPLPTDTAKSGSSIDEMFGVMV